MKPVFLDASGLIATVNTRDQWHDAARAVWKSLIDSPAPLLTTSLVLVELGDGLARVQHRQLAISLRNGLLSSDRVEVVPVSAALEQRGWDLYRNRLDKTWGLTDCVSIVVSQERGIERIFTADNHFEQAGFEILLTR